MSPGTSGASRTGGIPSKNGTALGHQRRALASTSPRGLGSTTRRSEGGGVLDLLKREASPTLGNGCASTAMQRWRRPRQPQRKIVATYDYVDETGALLFQVVRFDHPKTFKQRRPDGRPGRLGLERQRRPASPVSPARAASRRSRSSSRCSSSRARRTSRRSPATASPRPPTPAAPASGRPTSPSISPAPM